MQNVTVGANEKCLQHYDCADEWRCFFAPVIIIAIHTAFYYNNTI